jgi:hypothetical protein
MDTPTYTARQIDGAIFELLPDGSLRIRQAHAESITLPAETAYALYLFIATPGRHAAGLATARRRTPAPAL